MKPLGSVPEIQCWNDEEFFAANRALGGAYIFNLEGLAQGKTDKGFLFGGYLFRLVTRI
jgi:hypothetical protein